MDRRTKKSHLEALNAFLHLARGHLSALRGAPVEKVVLDAMRAVDAVGIEILMREERARGYNKAWAELDRMAKNSAPRAPSQKNAPPSFPEAGFTPAGDIFQETHPPDPPPPQFGNIGMGLPARDR